LYFLYILQGERVNRYRIGHQGFTFTAASPNGVPNSSPRTNVVGESGARVCSLCMLYCT